MTVPKAWKNKGESGAQELTAAEVIDLETRLANTYVVSAEAAGLALDGVTDDGPALNTLIAANVPSEGSQKECVISFPSNSTVLIATQVKRKGFVSLRGNGSHIKVSGKFSGSSVFTNSTTEKFARSDFIGFTIDKGELEGTLFDCNSMQHSAIRVPRLTGGTELCTNVSLKADGTQETDGDVKSNCAFNTIHVTDNGKCGYGLVCQGRETTAISGGSGAAVVTLNKIEFFHVRECFKMAFRFVEWCDNNVTVMATCSMKGEASTAVRYNDSATPAANVGVYANHFLYLTFEAYGTLYKKRKGVVAGWTKQNVIQNYFAEPLGPEGEAFENKNSQSHWIMQAGAEGNSLMRQYETPRELFQIGAEPNAPGTGFAKEYHLGGSKYVLYPAGTAKKLLTGSDSTMGFFSATPVSKPTVNKGSTADAINTALKELGLIGGT